MNLPAARDGVSVELGPLTGQGGRKVAQEVARVRLARPEVHNAFDDALIARLTVVLRELAGREDVRALVLTGSGRTFSAGADVRWMQRMADYTPEQNVADAERLADLLLALDGFPRPTVAAVNGAVYGGGLGLVAACDVVIAVEEARFMLSEVRLGVVPAVISPYVVRRIGPARARALFVTAERIGAAQAQAWGLVDRLADDAGGLDAAVGEVLDLIALGAPGAQAAAKRLVAEVTGRSPADLRASTSKLIAGLRAAAEGREGLSAFLEKRRPGWVPEGQ